MENSVIKGNSKVPERRKKDFKKRDGKESHSTQGVTCFECNGHGHFKKECPNYLRMKGKVYATTLSDSDSSNSDSEESCDGKGNYSAFMTVAHVESMDDLSKLVEELREHSDEESMGVVEESDAKENESTAGLQENYNSLLKKLGKYARVAKAAVKKMKKVEEDYRSLLVQYKETKCEMETMKPKGNLFQNYKEVRERTMSVIIVDFKGTPELIVIS